MMISHGGMIDLLSGVAGWLTRVAVGEAEDEDKKGAFESLEERRLVPKSHVCCKRGVDMWDVDRQEGERRARELRDQVWR